MNVSLNMTFVDPETTLNQLSPNFELPFLESIGIVSSYFIPYRFLYVYIYIIVAHA